MKLHLCTYYETTSHIEGKECLGEVCVLHHGVHHLQAFGEGGVSVYFYLEDEAASAFRTLVTINIR